MAAIPSTGSLIATHDYYRRRIGSVSSNSSCAALSSPARSFPTPRSGEKEEYFIFKDFKDKTRVTGGLIFSAKPPQPIVQNGAESQK
ncbi:hypothetical protein KUCAC02_031821 [Chaenocephalus aceratus]|nr:hypothetical protein KUCAC02_031821 [Chaenocephalus aceratus]